jgi:type II secretory pathway pseudopilin PulG
MIQSEKKKSNSRAAKRKAYENNQELKMKFLFASDARRNPAESGRSMIEMLGVLAIMGVITVGAITMISAAMRSQKRTALQDEVTQLVTGVRTIFGEYDDFSGLDNSTIFSAVGISDKNPYGGKYSLSVNSENMRQFILTIDGLNTSDCEYFKAKAWPDSVGYQTSDGRVGGAAAIPGDCKGSAGQNSVQVIYGE